MKLYHLGFIVIFFIIIGVISQLLSSNININKVREGYTTAKGDLAARHQIKDCGNGYFSKISTQMPLA